MMPKAAAIPCYGIILPFIYAFSFESRQKIAGRFLFGEILIR